MRRIYMIESISVLAKEFAKSLSGVYEVKHCTDTGNILKELDSFRPDLIVMDMSVPGYEPIDIVEHAYLSGIRPKILASTVYWHDALEERLTRADAGLMLLRPFTVDYLLMAAEEILLSMETGREADIRRITNDLLLRLGFRLDLQGYRYVLEAVVYAASHMDCMISCELYPVVARLCRVNQLVVERAMRRCIERAWLLRDDHAWNLYFPKDHNGRTRHLTNGAFVKRIAFAVNEYLDYQQGRKIAK